MVNWGIHIGDVVQFSKTVSEYDVYGFAGITGDFSHNHVNEQYMNQTHYGHRIAHGALMVGYMSTCSTVLLDRCQIPAVSYGYNRVRFTAAVYFGDTVTVRYEVLAVDEENSQARSKVEVTNQHGQMVAVAEHILKFFPDEA